MSEANKFELEDWEQELLGSSDLASLEKGSDPDPPDSTAPIWRVDRNIVEIMNRLSMLDLARQGITFAESLVSPVCSFLRHIVSPHFQDLEYGADHKDSKHRD